MHVQGLYKNTSAKHKMRSGGEGRDFKGEEGSFHGDRKTGVW